MFLFTERTSGFIYFKHHFHHNQDVIRDQPCFCEVVRQFTYFYLRFPSKLRPVQRLHVLWIISDVLINDCLIVCVTVGLRGNGNITDIRYLCVNLTLNMCETFTKIKPELMIFSPDSCRLACLLTNRKFGLKQFDVHPPARSRRLKLMMKSV